MTKHAPATPLYNTPYGRKTGDLLTRAMDDHEALNALRVNGFEPLAACNAYPRLVAALRNLCGRDVKAHHWDDARALLRDLGEG